MTAGRSGRSAVAMSPEEVDAFLRAQRKLQVASIGKDGTPHLTTLFHVVLDDGRLAFWTYARSQKVRNLERDGRLSCLVESGEDYFELKGVSLTGTAEVVREPERVRAIGAEVVRRMSGGADLGDLGRDIVEQQVPKRVGVVVTPLTVTSWDHGKMASLPGGGG